MIKKILFEKPLPASALTSSIKCLSELINNFWKLTIVRSGGFQGRTFISNNIRMSNNLLIIKEFCYSIQSQPYHCDSLPLYCCFFQGNLIVP